MLPNERRFKNKEAAEYLGVNPNTLAVWRSKGSIKIKYIKIGGVVFYFKSDLDKYLDECMKEYKNR